MKCSYWIQSKTGYELNDRRCRATLTSRHIHHPGDWLLSVPDLRIETAIGKADELTPPQAQQRAREIVLKRLHELMEVWE